MYPREPFWAAAFMNSFSRCLRVSTVAWGDAATGRWETGIAMVATRNATTRMGRKDFMETSRGIAEPFYSPGGKLQGGDDHQRLREFGEPPPWGWCPGFATLDGQHETPCALCCRAERGDRGVAAKLESSRPGHAA